MSFLFKNKIGQHNIFKIEIEKHSFLEYFRNLFDCENLQQLHLKSEDALLNNNLSDIHLTYYKHYYHYMYF